MIRPYGELDGHRPESLGSPLNFTSYSEAEWNARQARLAAKRPQAPPWSVRALKWIERLRKRLKAS